MDASTRVTVLSGTGKVVAQYLAGAKGDILPQGACVSSGWMVFLRQTAADTLSVELLSLSGKQQQRLLRMFAAPPSPGDPYAPPLAIGAGDYVATADPFEPTIVVRDMRGVPVRRYLLQEAAPVPPEDLSGLVPIPRGRLDNGRSVPRKASHWPYFKSMLFAENGTLWVRDFGSTRGADEVWTGIAENGYVVGRLTLTTNETTTELRALRFSACCVLVDRADEEGRLSIELLRLIERR